jgi:hypothetical protein
LAPKASIFSTRERHGRLVGRVVPGTPASPLSVTVGEAGIQDDPIPRQFVEEIKSPITYGELVARRQQAT